MFKLDLRKFKKVSGDRHHTVMRHEAGHEIRLDHKALAPQLRKELDKLPMIEQPKQHLAKGGITKQRNPKLEESKKVPHFNEGWDGEEDDEMLTQTSSKMPSEEEQIQQEAAMQPGATSVGSDEGVTSQQAMSGLEGVQPQVPLAPGAESPSTPQIPGAQALKIPEAPKPEVGKKGAEAEPEIPETPKSPKELAIDAIKQQKLYNSIAQDEAANQAAALKAQMDIQDQSNQRIKEINDKINQQNALLLNEVKNKKIDPNQFWHSMDTGQKVLAGISLFLGGFASGFGGGPNPALDYINKQIDRDIDAQMKDRSDKINLYKINLQLLGDQKSAELASRMQQLNMSALRTAQKTQQATSQVAKMNGQKITNDLIQQAAQIQQSLSLRQFIAKEAAKKDSFIPMNPADLIPKMVPERMQKEVEAEVKRAMDTKKLSKTALKNFDELTEEYKGFFGRPAAAIYTPAQRGILRDIIAQTVGDLTGSVRELAFQEAMNAYMPTANDTEYRSKKKREGFVSYLTSKQAAPTFRSWVGADIDRFEQTATAESAQEVGHGMGNLAPIVKMIDVNGVKRRALYDPITKQFLRLE